MGSFGDFYNKNKKKMSKDEMAKKAAKGGSSNPSWVITPPTVIPKGKAKKTDW